MKSKNSKAKINPSDNPIIGQPKDVFDMVNKYGTYEIQPTCDSDNEFPAISQGMPTDIKQISKKFRKK